MYIFCWCHEHLSWTGTQEENADETYAQACEQLERDVKLLKARCGSFLNAQSSNWLCSI
jgi:hypothetical protein